MESKPLKIRRLEKQLGSPFTLIKDNLNFPSKIMELGYSLDEAGEVFGIYFGEDLKDRINLGFLSDFREVRHLLITGVYIEDLSPIQALKKLEMLNLRNTGLRDLTPLLGLNKLRYLDLNLNRIESLDGIGGLTELRYLNIGKNRFSDIGELRKLVNLQELVISNNDIRDLSPILSLPKLGRVQLYNNPKVDIDYPPEIVRGGWASLREYSKNAGQLIIYRSVKMLLLGNSAVGKSTLLNFLVGEDISNGSTHGVVYKQFDLDDISYNVWDFGGQEYFHATHRLFFSPNALNIILWSTIESLDNLSLDYWLRTLQQLNRGFQSEALIVENKTDLNNPAFRATPLDQKLLQRNYPEIRFSYEAVSLTLDDRTAILKQRIGNLSQGLITNFTYPGYYKVFKTRIDELGKSVVSPDEINNRPGKKNVYEALKLFHNMGLLLYFPEIFIDKVFVRPDELLDLIYRKILNDEKVYRLTLAQIEHAIKGNQLELTAADLVRLMKYFDLFFEIKAESNVFFIPQYLPKQSIWIEMLERQIFRPISIRIIADNFLMNLVMQRVFSRYGSYVKKGEEGYVFWNEGILIEKEGGMLMIKFNRRDQCIEVFGAKNDIVCSLEKEVVDFILDMPEDRSAPKRNFDNHQRRIIQDTMDDEHPSFSPHGMISLSEMDKDHYQNLMESEYDRSINWKSDYFTVKVSLDGEYFINWVELVSSMDMTDVKTVNNSRESRVEKTLKFSNYLNIMDKPSTTDKEALPDKEAPSSVVNYNFHAQVKVGSIGSGNTINGASLSPESEGNQKQEPTDGSAADLGRKALRRWKLSAVILLVVYILVAFGYVAVIYLKVGHFANKVIFRNYINSGMKIYIESLYALLGGALIYRLGYDRLLDPSKQKAFLEMNKMKKK